MNCHHCDALTTNGLALCDLCRRLVADCLEFLPIYFRNLARWRPGRAGARPVPGSREPIRPGDKAADRVSRAVDEAGAMLTGWVKAFTDDRPQVLGIRPLEAMFADLAHTDLTEAETVTLICHGLRRWLTSIATLEWCGEFVRQIAEHEERLRALTETAIPGWYAGSCRRCQAPTYVMPGLTWLTCRVCGTTTHAADRLEIILNEARGWVARPKRLAETLVALLDSESSVERLYDRIRQWEARGRIEPVRRTDVDGDEVGPKRYRLGDVLDVLTAETHHVTQCAI